MTKAEYLKELEKQIAKLPAVESREILADYEEHFLMGAAAGKKEEEICYSLGTPKSVAQSILVDTWVSEAENSQTIVKRSGALAQVLFLILILAPFNFFMLVCPFLVMFALIIAGWAIPLAFGGAALAVMVAAVPIFLILGPLLSLSLVSACIGTLGASVLIGLVMWLVTRGLLWTLISYCKWNINIIKARTA